MKESTTLTYLHSSVIAVRDTQIKPLARFHLRTCVAVTFLLKHGDEWVGEVLCEAAEDQNRTEQSRTEQFAQMDGIKQRLVFSTC
jgi:hypothetical protein